MRSNASSFLLLTAVAHDAILRTGQMPLPQNSCGRHLPMRRSLKPVHKSHDATKVFLIKHLWIRRFFRDGRITGSWVVGRLYESGQRNGKLFGHIETPISVLAHVGRRQAIDRIRDLKPSQCANGMLIWVAGGALSL